jgi:hypothetical protein
MERTIRDLLSRVDDLMGRVERQSATATLEELRSIRGALKALLAVAQARGARRGAP